MNRIFVLLMGLIMISVSVLVSFNEPVSEDTGSQLPDISISYTPNAVIRIDSNADISSQGWPGSGLASDPWIIEGLEIDGTGMGYCIYIGNTTDAFVMNDNYLHDASGSPDDVHFNDSAVILYNVKNGQVSNNIITNSTHGIRLFNAKFNTIFLNEISSNTVGIQLEGGLGYSLYQTFHGENVDDSLGRFVDGVGDVDKDGYDDLIIGAPGFASDTGKAYVISGKNGTEIYNYTGEAIGDQYGGNVKGIGDADDDTYPDFMVMAAYNSEQGPEAGKAYVYSGQNGSILYEILGEKRYGYFGSSASMAGDVNNDGHADFIIGAEAWDRPATDDWGKYYVYSGIDNALLYSGMGEARGYYMGSSVGYAGDVNNDGFDDFMVGSWAYDNVGNNEGKVYIFSGQTGLEIRSHYGENNLDNLGRVSNSIYYAGDLDLDGFDDYMFSATRWEPTATTTDNYGRVYVQSGQTGTNLYTIDGENANDRFGRVVGCIGDVDLDGVDDYVASSSWYDGLSGKIYLYSGSTGNEIYNFVGTPLDEMGGVSDAGDVNGDGLLDLIIGAFNNSDAGQGTGVAYVYTSITPGSMNNTIEANNITSNLNFGIWIGTNSVSNEIFHNNLLINGEHAFDAAGTNTWNDAYPSGGNYWDDYSGIDLYSTPTQDIPPSDDIGDTPRTILGSGSSQDQYPLMFPFALTMFTIHLDEGWNLISIPPLLSSENIGDVLSSIDGKWDIVQTYNPTITNPWMSNNTMRPVQLNDLDSLNSTQGIWINCTEASGADLIIRGLEAESTAIQLKAGWNLVGYPSMTPKSITDSLTGTGFTEVEGYNASSSYMLGVLPGTYMMQPGEGYWIKVPSDTVWIVDW